MRVLITGVDQPLGRLAAEALRGEHELRLTGTQAPAPPGLEGLAYTPADPREPAQVEPLVRDVEAVLHLAHHARFPTPDDAAEKLALDTAARGTYVLLQSALAAGAGRMVLASRLDMMAAYPEQYRVDESWKPQPEAEAASLAPYLAELTLREFVRAEEMIGVCLRLGDLGTGPADTTPEDAMRAISRALTMELGERKYRWWLYHIPSGDRYPLGAAAHGPLRLERS